VIAGTHPVLVSAKDDCATFDADTYLFSLRQGYFRLAPGTVDSYRLEAETCPFTRRFEIIFHVYTFFHSLSLHESRRYDSLIFSTGVCYPLYVTQAKSLNTLVAHWLATIRVGGDISCSR
jgi:hypothetical protein